VLVDIIRRIHHRHPINSLKKKIVGKGNKIVHAHSILSSVIFDINGNDNLVHIGAGCVLNNVLFYIRGDHHQINIGAGCRFNVGGSLWFEDNNGCLVIGENSTFENVHIAVTEPQSRVEIGKECMFAYDIEIRTGDSHSIIDSTTGSRINYAKDINIGNHVWVAAHSIILKGVSIPDNCVIGTGSVVVNGFKEQGVIVAGNPAKIIKHNITWSRQRIYEHK
jgi:acetyltransferase-like isoleucine patch superfamily enzyme